MRGILTTCAFIALMACSPQSHAAGKSSTARAAAAMDVPAGAYTLDKTHASLIFRVNHLGFSNYTARFTRYDAKLDFDPANPASSRVEATIDPNSLELDNPPPGFADTLKGVQWLNAAEFPAITFRSTKVELTGANKARISGDFTLHGVTRPVVLDAIFNGGYAGHPMDPHARIGFSARGSLKRSEFGIAFGIPAAGSTMGVSDAVEVIIEAEFSGPAWHGAAPKSSSQ